MSSEKRSVGAAARKLVDGYRANRPADASPDHAEYDETLVRYFEMLEVQEKSLVAAGFPAEGCANFLYRYFQAYNENIRERFEESFADRVVVLEPFTRGQEIVASRELTVDFLVSGMNAMPDLKIYPAFPGERSLPCWDFTNNIARVAISWRAVARFSAPLALPDPLDPDGPRIRLAPTGGLINATGVDKYVFTPGEWKIARVDAEYDPTFALLSSLPLRLPKLGNNGNSSRGLHRMAAVERAVAPIMRRLRRD